MTLVPADRALTIDRQSELVAEINAAHAEVVRAGVSMLRHAANAGRLLQAAFNAVPRGQWMVWCAENLDIHITTVNTYRRIAAHQDELERAGVESINGAERYLKKAGGWLAPTRSAEEVQRARDMRAAGRTLREIADDLGVSLSTAHRFVADRSSADRRASEAKEARRALEREQRARVVRARGGAVAEAYSLIRRAAQQLDAARDTEQDRDARVAIGQALADLYRVEDAVVRAVRLHQDDERRAA
mgnify:CR=1 FL=1